MVFRKLYDWVSAAETTGSTYNLDTDETCLLSTNLLPMLTAM